MDEYKPNSNRAREEQKEPISARKVEKVITGVAKPRKKSEVRKLADSFVSKDAGSVMSYILMDVLLPAIKEAVWDMISKGTKMLLFGEAGISKGSNNTPASRVSYRQYYDDGPRRGPDRQAAAPRIANSGFGYNDIEYETLKDAEVVLDGLNELIDLYGNASILDLYDLAGVKDDNYTNKNYGWLEFQTRKPEPLQGGGYILRLSRARQLN